MSAPETIAQLAMWGWSLGLVTGAWICIIWDITDDDDRDL